MSTTAAYLILAAELAAGWALCGVHAVRYHSQPARLLAQLRGRPLPPPTGHHQWWAHRPAWQHGLTGLLAVVVDGALGAGWVTGHRTAVLAALAALVVIFAALVLRPRRSAPGQAWPGASTWRSP